MLLAFIVGTASAGAAKAETQAYTNSGQAIEATWSTCPGQPAAVTDCNYTTLYAARGTGFDRFVTLGFANLRVYPTGETQVLASATGYVQPAPQVTVSAADLARGNANGAVYLYGNCGNPNDYRTCYYFGVGSLSAAMSATAGTTSWPESRKVNQPSGVNYAMSTTGSSRPARATATAQYNGAAWALGRQIAGRVLKFSRKETFTCPGACPRPAGLGAAVAQGAPMPPTGAPGQSAAGVGNLLSATTVERGQLQNRGR